MTTTVRRVAVVTALAAAVGAFLWWYGNKHDFYDLKIYVRAIQWWSDGNRLYDYSQPDTVQGQLYFTYPPFAALLLWPFGQIPLGASITIFTVGTVVALAVTTWWLVAPLAARHGWPQWFAVGLALPLVFALESTRETITFGQLNMLLIVLILADMLFAVPGKSKWAGVGIGLATAIKLFPGIFIGYLLVTRRWRAAITASATAAGATLLAAAVAPRDSWQFWTQALWATERVGRTDYTGNQSLLGLLSRLVVPEQPNRGLWLLLAVAVAAFGLWRAATARDLKASAGAAEQSPSPIPALPSPARADPERARSSGPDQGGMVAALTLAGLTGALASPITWPHHLYWFVPAIVVLVDHSVRRRGWLALALLTYAVAVFGVVSFEHWGGAAPQRTDSLVEFLGRNAYVLLSVLLLALLPTRTAAPADASATSAVDSVVR